MKRLLVLAVLGLLAWYNKNRIRESIQDIATKLANFESENDNG